MTPKEKAKTFLKNFSFYQRLVIMNGVGVNLFWTEHYTRFRLTHHTLACIPAWFLFALLLRSVLGDEQSKIIALLLVFITIPLGLLFHFTGKQMVKKNRFIMENLSAFRKLYFESMAAYYILLLLLSFVTYGLLF